MKIRALRFVSDCAKSSSRRIALSRMLFGSEEASGQLISMFAQVELHLAGRRDVERMGPDRVDGADLLGSRVDGREIVDREAEMLHRRALLVALVEMQLQVADAEPPHRGAEVRRRELLEPEEPLVPQRGA